MISKSSVLVAVENEVSRRILEAQLESWGHTAKKAESGQQAWEMLLEDPGIALLIADRAMRRDDGLELCRCARVLQRRRYLHIMLLMRKGGDEDLLDVVDLGADAVLASPFHPSELLAQLRVAERIIALEDRLADRVEELTSVHRRIKEDLRAAAQMQKSLLPKEQPGIPSVGSAWKYLACEHVAGDMFNVFRLDEDRAGIYVLDVCGHGVQAALLSVTLSRMLSPLSQNGGLLKRAVAFPPYYEVVPPAEVARECNRLFPLVGDTNFFFTLLYGILDHKHRRFTYVRAGHPGPILVSAEGSRAIEAADGIAIGVEREPLFREETLVLAPGDRIILRSDGIEEAANPEGEEFGEERMLKTLDQTRHQSIQESVDTIWRRVHEFMRGANQRDDMTILGVELLKSIY